MKERREEILLAASKIFYRNGFEKTKIEEVAKEAGIGKGTIYEYFESKAQLFQEMVAYNRNRHLRMTQEVLDPQKSFRENFLALARFLAREMGNHCQMFESISGSEILAREIGALLLEQNLRMGELIQQVVQKAIQNGELRRDVAPEIVADTVLGTIYQHCSKKAVFLHQRPEDMDFEAVVDLILVGIRSSEETY